MPGVQWQGPHKETVNSIYRVLPSIYAFTKFMAPTSHFPYFFPHFKAPLLI